MANILIYTANEISVNMGGVERVAEVMIQGFMKNDHIVQVLFFHNESYGNKNKCVIQTKIPKENKKLFVKDFIRKNTFNVVINLLGLYNSSSSLIIDACKGQDVKIISVFHNSFDSLLWSNKKLSNLMTNSFFRECLRFGLKAIERFPWYKGGRYVYNHSNKIVLLSNSAINEYKSIVGDTKHKISVIHNPNPYTNIKNILWQRKDNVVLFVGRLDHQKGLDRLLEIWSKANVNEWSLKIIGDGPLKDSLISLAKELKISEKIEFLGKQDPHLFYQSAKIFIMTSLYEGFPMVLIESMSHGCVPIIYDSYPSASEIIGDRGYLIKQFNHKSFIKTLSNVLSDEQKMIKKSDNCIKYTHQFHPDIINNEWDTLIKSILDKS